KESGICEKVEHLFQRLCLDNRYQCKLKAADVLQLTSHSLQFHESCAEKDLIQTFLQKLLMMNYRARYIKSNETDKQHDEKQRDNDLFEDEADVDVFTEMLLFTEETNRREAIHPMDVQMAVFHCADSFLKQLMVTKLSQCQYALPLLVPDPFTHDIEFPLWTFRQINKSWKMNNAKNEIISTIQPVWKAETPMVSFFRFGSLSSSKSQLINSLINDKHNMFFHRNCPGSSKIRLLMDGVVEIAWYFPSGKDTDKFNQCIAFCNLHGDAADHEKQLQILTKMASVNVVILPRLDRNDKSGEQIQKLFKDRKPLIFLFTEDKSRVTKMRKGKYKIGLKDRSQSDVSEDLEQVINKCLSFSSSESLSLFKLEDVSKCSGIRVDEDHDSDCKRGKEVAQQMRDLLEEKNLTEIKESFLPCQGKLWHQWCEKNKELHRSQGNERDMVIKQEQDMKKTREDQHVLDICEFIKLFITEVNSQSPNEKMFFLKWITILLDEYTSSDLSTLRYKYYEKWSEVLKLREKNGITEQQVATNLTDEQTELDRIAKALQAATFGLEHILREIGQIYESCQSVNKNKEGLPCDFSSLPGLAAEMMISGFPLELMDGDAAHVPVVWVTAVLHELIQKLGDKRVFVLSVLGIQSSGKSTMLNAMFGLQFAVSAGRCTRGAFMQLVKVSEEMKEQLKFDFILVVDTEGLRAPELAGRSTRHQDNELATFVVGLGNLTLINIFGENPSELQEILQIVVQAFMRMKKVNLSPSCVFVHQNISDVTAGEKNMEGRRRLQQTLDEMTKIAAKDEVYVAECFSDVITFDIRKDVKYFAQLWEGSPPMVPPNPSYCENIQELKTTVFSHALKSDGLKLTHLKSRINDLWEALLNERFVFSFRNSLEIATYRKLETEYSKTMLDIENEFYNNIENERIDEVSESHLREKLKVKSGEVEKSMSQLFEKDKDKDILKQQANDPVLYFEKKSKEYYGIFQKYCQGATSDAIFGEIICQKLKEPIQKSVCKDTARDLTNEIRTNCESLNGNRSKLEKYILKTLAEKEDFEKYMNYLNNPRDHFKSFISDEVSQYITDKFEVSVRPKMREKTELLHQKIIEAVHNATTLVNTTNGDVQKWLNHFTQQLSNVLIFSVKDLNGVSHDSVNDFSLLEDVIRVELKSVSSEIKQKFSTETFPVNLEHKDRPDEILIDHLCQCCWVQCPFCGASCTNTIEKHSGDHSVPFHRVNGFTG
ncbi:hypothetical protein M9458_043446, partial [Cirrhinus mrigala]